jgi:cold-inducible RNA-binding protein
MCYTENGFDVLANSRLTSLAAISLPRPPTLLAVFKSVKGIKRMKNIFVGNLSFGATEDALRSLFEAHGTVGRVNIVTDRDSGQPRGFGFVEMNNDAEGDKAINALNGRDLDGRTLNVNEARPKAERSSGGGGGGGGFNRKRW